MPASALKIEDTIACENLRAAKHNILEPGILEKIHNDIRAWRKKADQRGLRISETDTKISIIGKADICNHD